MTTRLHRYGAPSELVMWEDEDTEQTGFAHRYECVKCGGCPITMPVRDEAVQ